MEPLKYIAKHCFITFSFYCEFPMDISYILDHINPVIWEEVPNLRGSAQLLPDIKDVGLQHKVLTTGVVAESTRILTPIFFGCSQRQKYKTIFI